MRLLVARQGSGGVAEGPEHVADGAVVDAERALEVGVAAIASDHALANNGLGAEVLQRLVEPSQRFQDGCDEAVRCRDGLLQLRVAWRGGQQLALDRQAGR